MRHSRFPSLCSVVMTAACIALLCSEGSAYYTTKGKNIIDRVTGDSVVLKGFGLGGWLLPEGYMWGIHVLDRPRQFEAAIIDLIGADSAKQFWRLYYANYLTEDDIRLMRSWGASALRVALNANVLQPRDGQPDQPPYIYNEEGWAVLDSFVDWCQRFHMGIIWDMHGAPGAQNRENFSDSDGEARLWTEKDRYWPRCIDLWFKIADRYKTKQCIIGYDLLNEPLLTSYGLDGGLLRELYVKLTDTIRTVDSLGIMFVEGDDYAQTFTMLEPIDWDKHIALAFHSYPPTGSSNGLLAWDTLRAKYGIPLWHGETGEQGPPYEVNKNATTFLNGANVGWSFWTHKKFDLLTQPWNCHRTDGFNAILSYWNNIGSRPSAAQATQWLFDQARRTHTDYCDFLPDMVQSLVPLDPSAPVAYGDTTVLSILQQPKDALGEEGGAALFRVYTRGHPVSYQWFRNGALMTNETSPFLLLSGLAHSDSGSKFFVTASNAKGTVTSDTAILTVTTFSGPVIPHIVGPVVIDGTMDTVWNSVPAFSVTRVVQGAAATPSDLSASWRAAWDETNLYLFVQVTDDVLRNNAVQSYENDGVELFVDVANGKSYTYDKGDFQFRYVWNTQSVEIVQGAFGAAITAGQKNTQNGYAMEMSIPWSGLGQSPQPGQFMGFEVQVNDNDSISRKTKIAWYGQSDIAWQMPKAFGTIRLGPTAPAVRHAAGRVAAREVFSLSRKGKWLVCTLPSYQPYCCRLMSVNGRCVSALRGTGVSYRLDTKSLTKGVYLLRISAAAGVLEKKIVIAP